MADDENVNEAKILQDIILKLSPLSIETRTKILRTIGTFFDMELLSWSNSANIKVSSPVVPKSSIYSDHSDLSPKEFLLEKAPKTDIEKVVCIAYYLTHYREMPHFKTVDISKINTEAAQLKFSNAAKAVNNASSKGFLVPAGKGGMKQISAIGERFVSALPDRDAARDALSNLKVRKNKKSKSKSSSKTDVEDN